jgi:hypothetical protein
LQANGREKLHAEIMVKLSLMLQGSTFLRSFGVDCHDHLLIEICLEERPVLHAQCQIPTGLMPQGFIITRGCG